MGILSAGLKKAAKASRSISNKDYTPPKKDINPLLKQMEEAFTSPDLDLFDKDSNAETELVGRFYSPVYSTIEKMPIGKEGTKGENIMGYLNKRAPNVDKSEVESCIFKSIFLKDVPAIDASIPVSANLLITAVVASIEIFAAAEIGATFVIDVWNFSISIAEDVNDKAMTSVTLAVSAAERPKPLTLAPATVAALAKSESVATANAKVASCAFKISLVENPNLPKFACNSATCFAVKKVDLPKSCADFVN